jgi:hypothetical protein
MKTVQRNFGAGAFAVLACGLLWGAACASKPKAEPAGPLIEAMGMTTLYSPDPGRLAEWYGSRFRIPLAREGNGYILKDNTGLGPVWIVIDPAGTGKPQSLDISFFVRNLDQVLGQLSIRGTAPLRLDRDGDGRPKAIVVDPDGNRIELVQR